jgi:hypothetical protein
MRPKTIKFNGHTYGLRGRYYHRFNYGTGGPANLHRAIWEDHNGPIPGGYEVHHKDEDTFNNDIDNLELIEASEHRRMHMKTRHERGNMGPPTAKALDLAAEWHRSADGLEWHGQHGKRTWETRVWYEKACEQCGQAFMTPYPTRARFCHLNCKMTALRARRGRPVGTRPNRKKGHKPRVPTASQVAL